MNTLPKYLPADERRAATVEAVVALAAVQNPSEITTAAIAKRMGVTQGALFRHFPSKDSILEAVMGWVSNRLLTRLDAARAGARTPMAALEAVFLAHIDFVAAHPGVPRMLFGELQRAGDTLPKQAVQVLIGHYAARITDLLKRGVEAGEIDSAIDITTAAIQFIGSIQGLVIQSTLEGKPRKMRENAPAIFALYRRGIEARS